MRTEPKELSPTLPMPYHNFPLKTDELLGYLFSTGGGLAMAISDRSEFWLIVGAAVSGSGFMGLLGAILANIMVFMKIGAMHNTLRFLANWLFGLNAIWLAPLVQPKWFPSTDIVFITLALSAALALFGIVIFEAAGQKVVGKFRRWINKQ